MGGIEVHKLVEPALDALSTENGGILSSTQAGKNHYGTPLCPQFFELRKPCRGGTADMVECWFDRRSN